MPRPHSTCSDSPSKCYQRHHQLPLTRRLVIAGNLHVDPRAAIVALDYSTGDVLQLTGSCSILWDQHDLPGAERTLQFTTQVWNWAPGGIPLAASEHPVKPSPYNPAMESWQHHHDAAKVGALTSHLCSNRLCVQGQSPNVNMFRLLV